MTIAHSFSLGCHDYAQSFFRNLTFWLNWLGDHNFGQVRTPTHLQTYCALGRVNSETGGKQLMEK